jgi:hypothetical protein
MITFKKFLVEKVIGNTGWVYHRTHDNPEGSEIITHGIKPSTNQSAMYGKGLYCCYDFDQQLKPNMEKYGEYILKGKIDLNGFAILDEDIYQLANPKGNFESHLRKIGTDIENVKDETPYTSSIAQNIWKECKQNGYNGIIFTGRNDGKVAVIWNRRNFIPYQYSKDAGVTWKKLTPDIKAIKRPHDFEYDFDDETIRFPKLLKQLSNEEEMGDLNVPNDYKESIFLKNMRNMASINAINANEINFPFLQMCWEINTPKASKINLPRLITSNTIHALNANKINLPHLEVCSNIYAHEATEMNLPQLNTSGSIFAHKATEINLPRLVSVDNNYEEIGLIVVSKAKKIIIPKHLKDKLHNVPSDCEIIHPENAPQIKVNEDVTFKKYLMLKESLVQIPLDSAYEIFKNEYDKSTGTSWTYDKFMGRARNWEFYGDEKGYVAIRRQRSGLVKLVGMAGDNRSKLKGINDLISMKMPLWGMVSKDIKDIAVRRGMREPNFLERQVLKRSIPPEVLGGAEILEYQKDGGIKLQYPDVGVVVKYLVGTPEYYAKLRTMLGDKVKEKILG